MANLNVLFKHGDEVYRGYVDDPRNTDNAWMETVRSLSVRVTACHAPCVWLAHCRPPSVPMRS
jgi:hypothetical protein